MEANNGITTANWPFYGKALGGIFLAVTFVLIMVGNIFVIIVQLKAKIDSIPNSTKHFMISLALSDLGIGTFIVPLSLATLVDAECCAGMSFQRLSGFTNYCFCMASILTLAMLSIDRYIALAYPMRLDSILTPFRSKTICALIWAYSLIVAIPVAATSFRFQCLIPNIGPCSLKDWTETPDLTTVTIALITSTFTMTLGSMFYSYFRIFLIARRHARNIVDQAGQVVRARQEITNCNEDDNRNSIPLEKRMNYLQPRHLIQIQSNSEENDLFGNTYNILSSRSTSFSIVQSYQDENLSDAPNSSKGKNKRAGDLNEENTAENKLDSTNKLLEEASRVLLTVTQSQGKSWIVTETNATEIKTQVDHKSSQEFGQDKGIKQSLMMRRREFNDKDNTQQCKGSGKGSDNLKPPCFIQTQSESRSSERGDNSFSTVASSRTSVVSSNIAVIHLDSKNDLKINTDKNTLSPKHSWVERIGRFSRRSSNCSSQGKGNRLLRGHFKTGMRLARNLLLIIIVFFLCWCPMNIMILIETAMGRKINHDVSLVFMWIVYANSFCNPIIYCFRYQSFREALVATLKVIRSKFAAGGEKGL